MKPTRSLLSPLVLLGACAALAACGGDSDDPGTDPTPDAGGDTAPGDAEDDGSETDTGDPLPPPATPFSVIFVQQGTSGGFGGPDYRQVMVTDSTCRVNNPEICQPGACTVTEIEAPSAAEALCEHGCFVTPSLSHIVYFDREQSRTLRVAPLGADRQLSGPSQVIATDLLSVSVGEDIVVWRAENAIRSYRLSTGVESNIATLTGSGEPWVTPDGSRVFLRRVTSLTSMDVQSFSPDGGQDTLVYSFVDGVPQNLAGSLLGGSEPLAISPDGTRLAMLASVRIPTTFCSAASDCATGEQCPVQSPGSRCFSHQVVAYVINLQETGRLGSSCTADADCGQDHRCDRTAPAGDGSGECIPGRFSFGPGGPNSCQAIQPGQYNNYRSSLGWRSDRSLVGIFSNNCGGRDIPVTDIVAVDIGTGSLTRLTENVGSDHGGPACFDSVEQCFRPDRCNVEFKQFSISPDGGTVVAVGNSYTSRLSDHLWTIDSFNRSPRTQMTRSIQFNVRSVSTHD